MGTRSAEVITTALLFISMVFAWVSFVQVGLGGQDAHVMVANFFTVGGLKVEWALWINTLTAVMLVVVTTVSALVHLYSIGYMSEDPYCPRFFSYLSFFTFAMLMLVTADNLVQLFFGWEGVGLASYLLIGFWYHKPEANAAAIKAFVVNRIGDFGFALGIFAVFLMTGAVDLETVFAQAPSLVGKSIHFLNWDVDALTLICLLLFMGAMGKSAQFLLHTWLPDAMEGPTPVSALIHAATMVTAGVFMVARLSPLFDLAPNAQAFVTFIGATTCVFAGTIALVQNDIKRIVAYSTCSELGYMFVAMGVGPIRSACSICSRTLSSRRCCSSAAGSVITAMHHEQDIRNMGGLFRRLPFTYVAMVVGSLALTGFPLTAATSRRRISRPRSSAHPRSASSAPTRICAHTRGGRSDGVLYLAVDLQNLPRPPARSGSATTPSRRPAATARRSWQVVFCGAAAQGRSSAAGADAALDLALSRQPAGNQHRGNRQHFRTLDFRHTDHHDGNRAPR